MALKHISEGLYVNLELLQVTHIILDLTVVLKFAIDGVWINFLNDFGERFREKSVS